MKFELPFVSRAEHRKVELENYTLRDALKAANEELRRYNLLVADLQERLNNAAPR